MRTRCIGGVRKVRKSLTFTNLTNRMLLRIVPYYVLTPLTQHGLIMSRKGNFFVYCIEQYKSAKGLTGVQVSELFNKYRVWDYIYSCFEALHTTGENYIIEDIDSYIETRHKAMV